MDTINICTCNNCGNIWEDTNPGEHSRNYKYRALIPLEYVMCDGGIIKACPICKTDGYLVDNINYNVYKK